MEPTQFQELFSFLQTIQSEDLFPQYVDIKDRSLQDIIVSDREPPTFSNDAFDAVRALQRITDYLIWTSALNDQRKSTGERITDLLNNEGNAEAARLSGVQEVGLHLITITADAVAKHFTVLSEKISFEVDSTITSDIGMFGTLRNDFEHPNDDRGIFDRHGKKFYRVEKDEDGGVRGFNWNHGLEDSVASRKGYVPMSDEGIIFHRRRVQEGLKALRAHCICHLMEMIQTPEQEIILRWMFQRQITISVGLHEQR